MKNPGNFLLILLFLTGIAITGNAQLPDTLEMRTIALTFDDGPDPVYTRQILKVLKREQVPATFFLVGKEIPANRKVVKKILKEGHCIGNHSYTHLDLWNYTCRSILEDEIEKNGELIRSAAGVVPRFFRAPYGDFPDSCRATIESKGYYIVKWDVDPRDYDTLTVSSSDIVKFVTGHVTDKSVVLLHCAGGNRSNTATALTEIIRILREEGYEFLRMDDLYGLPAYF